MNYKIIATDFDGTLLTSDKHITEKNKNTLIKCKDKGYIIVGITARNLSSVKSILDVKMFNYLILNNGCFLYDVKNEKGIYIKGIDRKTVVKITNHFKKIAKGIDYISSDKYYMFRNKGDIDPRNFVEEVKDVEEVPEFVSRMNIMADNINDIPLYKKYLDENVEEVDSIIMRDTDDNTCKKWIASNPKGLNKLTTLKRLCEILDINTTEVIFFGDSANDKEIIKNVGLGVAMGNALPEVKEVAKSTTITNDENGVAYFLDKTLND